MPIPSSAAIATLIILASILSASSRPAHASGAVIRPFINFHSASSDVSSSGRPADANDRMLFLVPSPSPSLTYHGGPLLTGRSVHLHVLWYGSFSSSQQSAILDFISSFSAGPRTRPSVPSWWRIARRYSDSAGSAAAAAFKLRSSASDATCRLFGKNLTEPDHLSRLVAKAVSARYLPRPSRRAGVATVYVVFTAEDVLVDDFCMNSCGTHDSVAVVGRQSEEVPFVWVGDAGRQCPGLCAWPYAVSQYGPRGPALAPPNGEAATDGMIVNLALLLAGTVTNPFGTGYYEGDADAPLEAGSACQGMFGSGSYAGYPGQLLQESDSGASYNAFGAKDRRFLLPALWNPATATCVTPI